MRLLLVESPGILPNPVGNGNTAIRWSLLAALRAIGHDVATVVFDEKAGRPDHVRQLVESRRLLAELECELSYFAHESLDRNRERMQEIVDTYKPDGLLLYGPETVELMRPIPRPTERLAMSIDPYHLPMLYKSYMALRHGHWKRRARALVELPRTLRTAWRVRAEMLDRFGRIDRLVNHAANHARWLESKLGRPCLYVPNPLMPVEHPAPSGGPRPAPPRFLLVGNFDGIATLSGLYFFADEVLPALEPALRAGELEIHLTGRGSLDPNVRRAFDRAGIVERGWVDDVTAEYRAAWAMIVPTPIALGFRTRIIDAFRHRLCVVAHAANAAGFPELRHETNCLLAGDGRTLAGEVLRVARDEALRRRLAEQAYRDFTADLSALAVASNIVAFLGRAGG